MNVAVFTVGSNPLPVYVVAEYLLKTPRQDEKHFPRPDYLIFVYSKETEKIQEKIQERLRDKFKQYVRIEGVDLGNGEREEDTVLNSLKNKLLNLSKSSKISTLHLHYTGGTKPMSVFSYLAVKEFAQEQGIKAIFSDLHPDEAVLVSNQQCSDDLRKIVRLNVDQIIKLHGMDISHSGNQQLEYPDLDMKSFEKEIPSLIDMSLKYNKYNKSGNEEEKNQIIKELNSIFSSIMPKSWEEYVKNSVLTGKWLEDYMLYQLQQLQNEFFITDLRKSVKAKYNGRDCEIDVVAIRGYQMYLFSCTTSDGVKSVKGKAFEAIYRADQLGGSHARVIVVSLLPQIPQSGHNSSIETLENDLSSFDARFNKKCKLIGRDDLLDQEKLKANLLEVFKD